MQSNDKSILSSSGTISFVSNNTAGNLIVVAVAATGGSSATPTDSRNTYLTAVANQLSSTDSLSIYYAQNIGAGANTVSVSASGATKIQVVIFEYSGLAIAGALDQAAAASGTSSTPTSPSVTTLFAPELVVGVELRVSPGLIEAGVYNGVYNNLDYALELCRDGCSDGNIGTEDLILSPAQTLAAPWGGASVLNWAAAIATFSSTPLTYNARTDMCAESNSDYINGASGTQCQPYGTYPAGSAQQLAFQGQGSTNATTGVWTPAASALTYLPSLTAYTGTPCAGSGCHAGTQLQCADSLGLHGCGGAATAMVDPDFGANIFRATDYDTYGPPPGANFGQTFGVGDNGQFRVWDLNNLAYLLFNSDGGLAIVSFSNNNDAYSIPSGVGGRPSTVWCGTSCTTFTSNEVAWSAMVADRMWELDSRTQCCTGSGCATGSHPECQQGALAPFNQLNEIMLSRTGATPASWTISRTPMINFTEGYTSDPTTGNAASCVTGLPVTYLVNWSGSMNTGQNEDQFEFTFSDDGQGGVAKPSDSPAKLGSIYTVAWKPGFGCAVLQGSPDANGRATYAGDWSASGYPTSGEAIIGNSNTPSTTVFYDSWYLHAGGIESDTAIAQFAPATNNIINSPINPPSNMAITAATEYSTYVTFTTASLSGLLPSTWPVGAQVVIAGMTPGSSTTTPYGWDCPPNNLYRTPAGTWPGCIILASPAPTATSFSVCVNSGGTNGCLASGLGTITHYGNASPGTACFGMTTNNLCENYYWQVGTPFVDFTTLSGHTGKGQLYDYKGKFYNAFNPATPESYLGPLLPSTEPYTPPVDQHLSYWNANSGDLQPVLGFTTNVCGLGTAPKAVGGNVCGCPTGSTSTGADGTPICPASGINTTYANVCAASSITQCPEVNEIMGAQNIVTNPSITSCANGEYPYSGGCIYRFAHNFGSGTSWYFETQNMVGNVSPNGRWAVFASDWFAGVGNWPLGCTNGANGTTEPCEDNITANGKNNVAISAASESGYIATFTTASIAGFSPSAWPCDDTPCNVPVIVSGFVNPYTGYNGTWVIQAGGTATQFTAMMNVSGIGSCSGVWCGTPTASLQCSADKTSPCPRGDVFVVDLLSAH